jgi:hypothetical protein
VSHALVAAKNEKAAMKKSEKIDFTHDNGIEVQNIEYA